MEFDSAFIRLLKKGPFMKKVEVQVIDCSLFSMIYGGSFYHFIALFLGYAVADPEGKKGKSLLPKLSPNWKKFHFKIKFLDLWAKTKGEANQFWNFFNLPSQKDIQDLPLQQLGVKGHGLLVDTGCWLTNSLFVSPQVHMKV